MHLYRQTRTDVCTRYAATGGRPTAAALRAAAVSKRSPARARHSDQCPIGVTAFAAGIRYQAMVSTRTPSSWQYSRQIDAAELESVMSSLSMQVHDILPQFNSLNAYAVRSETELCEAAESPVCALANHAFAAGDASHQSRPGARLVRLDFILHNTDLYIFR